MTPRRNDLIAAAAREIASWRRVPPARTISVAEIRAQNEVGWRLPGTDEWPEKVYFTPTELERVLARARGMGAKVEER